MAYGDRGKVFGTGGWKTQALEHYRVRAGVPAKETLWLQRAYDKMMRDYGLENWGVAPNWFYEWAGWGTLTKQRTDWMAGDAGTWKNGVRQSGIPAVPCKIKAVDYDYYAGKGESHTYHNEGQNLNGVYRPDGTVEIAEEKGEYYVTEMKAGEWMNYTLVFPAPEGNVKAGPVRSYRIYATYRTTGKKDAALYVAIDGGKKTGGMLKASSGWAEAVLGTVEVECGAAVMRVSAGGENDVLQLKALRVVPI